MRVAADKPLERAKTSTPSARETRSRDIKTPVGKSINTRGIVSNPPGSVNQEISIGHSGSGGEEDIHTLSRQTGNSAAANQPSLPNSRALTARPLMRPPFSRAAASWATPRSTAT